MLKTLGLLIELNLIKHEQTLTDQISVLLSGHFQD